MGDYYFISVASSSSERNRRDALFSTCDCLPACNELSYNIEIVSQPRNWTFNGRFYGLEDNNTNLSVIQNFLNYYYVISSLLF